MGTGDSPEMQRMQDEAIQRAREMRRRAQLPFTEEEKSQEQAAKTGEVEPSMPVESTTQEPADDTQADQEESSSRQTEQGQSPMAVPSGPIPSLLDNLFKNHEQTLILILLILIGGESGNHELMFALLFLLM